MSRRKARFRFPTASRDEERDFFNALARQPTWQPVEGPELPGRVWVRLGLSKDGRIVCTGLVIADEPPGEVTTRRLQNVRLGAIVNDLSSERALSPEVIGGLTPGDKESDFARAFREALTAQAMKPKRGRHRQALKPGPKTYSNEHFEEVAREYQKALLDSPRSPVKTLAARLGVSEATIYRWLATARERGLLATIDLKRQAGWYGKSRKGKR